MERDVEMAEIQRIEDKGQKKKDKSDLKIPSWEGQGVG